MHLRTTLNIDDESLAKAQRRPWFMPVWTLDKRLAEQAERLSIRFEPPA